MMAQKNLIVAILLSFGVCFAQLGLEVGTACFASDENGKTWVEVFTKFDRSKLKFDFDDEKKLFRAQFALKILVLANTETKNVIDSLKVSAPVEIPENRMISEEFRVLDAFDFLVPYGEGEVIVIVRDLQAGSEDTAREKFAARAFDKAMDISDIMLSWTATPVQESTALEEKNVRMGYKMYPNPTGKFDAIASVVYYYVEFYAQNEAEHKIALLPQIFLQDSIIRRLGTVREVFRKSGGYVAGFSIGDLPDGTYSLRITLADSTGKKVDTAQKAFTIARKKASETANTVNPEMRDMLVYLLTTDKLSIYDRLDDAGKIAFWNMFWEERDPNAETIKNEAFEEYSAKWNFVQRQFEHGDKPGWKTDQGRIYLLYGAPDNIENHTFGSGENSWEVWSYFSQNRFLIFADALGLGEKKIVHSNIDGEVQNTSWKSKLSSPQNQMLRLDYDN